MGVTAYRIDADLGIPLKRLLSLVEQAPSPDTDDEEKGGGDGGDEDEDEGGYVRPVRGDGDELAIQVGDEDGTLRLRGTIREVLEYRDGNEWSVAALDDDESGRRWRGTPEQTPTVANKTRSVRYAVFTGDAETLYGVPVVSGLPFDLLHNIALATEYGSLTAIISNDDGDLTALRIVDGERRGARVALGEGDDGTDAPLRVESGADAEVIPVSTAEPESGSGADWRDNRFIGGAGGGAGSSASGASTGAPPEPPGGPEPPSPSDATGSAGGSDADSAAKEGAADGSPPLDGWEPSFEEPVSARVINPSELVADAEPGARTVFIQDENQELLQLTVTEEEYETAWDADCSLTAFLDAVLSTPFSVGRATATYRVDGAVERETASVAEIVAHDWYPEGCLFLAVEVDSVDMSWESMDRPEGNELAIAGPRGAIQPFRSVYTSLMINPAEESLETLLEGIEPLLHESPPSRRT